MIPAPWRCPKRIGFLFPHPCDRITPVGCPYCQDGQIDDPYRSRSDRHLYSDDFDSYSTDDFSSGSERAFSGFGGGDAGGGGASGDFTEADGESLDDSSDSGGEFEDDLSAS